MSLFENFKMPHIRYISTTSIMYDTPEKVEYYEYIGKYEHLIQGKKYKFYETSYSPNQDTPRKTIMVTKDEQDKYVHLDLGKNEWKRI